MRDSKQRIRLLAGTYLGIIMSLSLLFSVLLFSLTTAQLERPLPPPRMDSSFSREEIPAQVQSRIDERTQQTKQSLLTALIALNLFMISAGGVLSYMLAKKALKPIEEALEAQSRFVTDASHELRTPLTALQLTNDVALRKKQITDSAARVLLKKNNVEVEKLRLLTESLLRLSETTNEPLQATPIDLRELLLEIRNTMQVVASHASISIKLDLTDAVIIGDATSLSQIITILLDNAIKYSHDNGVVCLHLQKNKESVTISVKDNGIGIADENQPHIFDRFYRVDASRSRSQSTSHGIGLSIAKSLSDRLGYSLTLKSHLGVGSTFTLRIPSSGSQ